MDDRVLTVINHFARATPWLHAVVLAYASYGVAMFAGLLVAGWWVARRSNQPQLMAAALCAGAATVLAVALNQPIVAAVARGRPYSAHTDLLILAHRSADASFPSDHATMAGAAAAGLWLVSRLLGAIAAVGAITMAFARVYIGAHYPADVLAGLLLGAVVAVVLLALVRTALTRIVTAAGRTRLRPLLTGNQHSAP
jgi:undecaprenyl-diphosphatase